MPVRRLTPSHAASYRSLMLRAYADETEAFTATVPERERMPQAWWEDRVSDQPDAPQRVFGAFDEEALVGVVGLRREQRERTRHRASLFGVYVLPARRRRGVARMLVEAALAHARSTAGLRIVRLGFIVPNEGARRLYASLGFVPYGAEPYAVRIGRQYRSVVHLWRAVDRPATGSSE